MDLQHPLAILIKFSRKTATPPSVSKLTCLVVNGRKNIYVPWKLPIYNYFVCTSALRRG